MLCIKRSSCSTIGTKRNRSRSEQEKHQGSTFLRRLDDVVYADEHPIPGILPVSAEKQYSTTTIFKIELLKKDFATKTPLQRHGVLLLDEINLRKSVAVCSKNLTYVGLTDLGDDGLRSSDISEQATHGLVVMFQFLADTYTQPIAVFASKNPVKGEELAKLVVKGIIYLERCGTTIHGVIADGAATNQKMWSLLKVRGTMQDTKTWFTHPLDDEKKVFVFSDTPHVIKNIRNRLLNQKKLRLNSENYIRWQYFETLYELDTNHPGNARACPKITERHVHMDNASKMRVRLATQIFSNSVAQGLAFYLSHNCKALAGF
ncbi:uncharacterized protein LOC112457862 [Temnothorax curvispinosus]|uniref:Uncharacterized protein LOC112457862 n=1 Tax=Temnothorax curvispinosus TaxID=300111 RepID=A0A6J1Q5I1_9HYME|nr:uncharacterized protein LOC112457862 [Temnothorax curvispinosus]